MQPISQLKSLVPIALGCMFMFACNADNDSKHLYLQPLGKVPATVVDSVQSALVRMYPLNCSIRQEMALPKEAFTNIKSPRYRADSILRYLSRIHSAKGTFVMGITQTDISTTKYSAKNEIKQPHSKYRDWGVFGLGQRPGKSSVISTHRLRTDNQTTFVHRIQKVAVHEFGHNLGLKHCQSGESCVMQDAAESIKTIDRVKMELCSDCQRKIKLRSAMGLNKIF